MLALQIIVFLIFLLIWLGLYPYADWTVIGISRALGLSIDLSGIIGIIFVIGVPISIFIIWIIHRTRARKMAGKTQGHKVLFK